MTSTIGPWEPDQALDGFEALTIALPPDDEGPVVATLVRRRAPEPQGRAALYLHGFIDYFFQAHLAEAFNAHGYDFYALDLRKHGRSLRPHQTPNYCRDLREYYPELEAAIGVITEDDSHRWLLLNGHSTGGLIAALYAHEGRLRDRISGLFLNSPYLRINVDRLQAMLSPVAIAIGGVTPRLDLRARISPLYAQSIHRDHRGEWQFNLAWKPLTGFSTYAGWWRAITTGQRRVQAGLQIACPILIMHSARSLRTRLWSDELLRADGVLDVAHMRRYGPGLGPDVTMVAVEGGMHDLTLSAPPVRELVFRELFGWLERRYSSP